MTEITTPHTAEPRKCRKSCKFWGALALVAVFGLGYITAKATTYFPLRAFYGGYSQHHMGGINKAERRLDMVLTAVDATQDQRDKIKSTLLKAMADMPAHKTEMRGFARGGLDILGAASLDSAKLDATRLAALKSMETHSAKHQVTLLEIAAILTPEQRQKLKTLAEMRLNRHN